MFVDDARELAGQGRLVLMDATAHRRRWRDRARREIARFAEVWVRCPLEVAMQREESRPEGKVKAGLYKKALERKRTGKQFEGLGPVIGVDEPYEESPRAEVVVDSEGLSVQQARDRVLEYLDNWRTS
jgi:adenylylsulfate kinase